MKLSKHILVFVVGAVVFVAFFKWSSVTDRNPLQWYHRPMWVTLYFGYLFGDGGKNVSVLAVNVAFWIEVIIAGLAANACFFILQRWKGKTKGAEAKAKGS